MIEDKSVFDAARAGDLALLRTFYDHADNPDWRTDRGDTPLIIAGYHARIDVVDWLIAAGCDINARNQQRQTALTGAAFKGFLPIVQRLIAAGADIDPIDAHGKTPFLYAAAFEQLNVLNTLIEHGANIHQRDGTGKDALRLARDNHARRVIPRLEALLAQDVDS